MKAFANKIINRTLIIAILYVMFIAISDIQSVKAGESFEENAVTYQVLNRDSVTVCKYNGNESTVIIPEEVQGYKVVSISAAAFDGNQFIKSVTLPKSIETIEKFAFSNSTLESIDIPEYIETVGYSAFEGTPLYANAGEDIKYVGSICLGADEDCTLEEISIKDSTRMIADGAFEENNYITKVELPDDLTYIGESAFKRCANLTTINIPMKTQDNIGVFAFYQDSKLTNVTGDLEALEQNQGFVNTPLQARWMAKKMARITCIIFALLVCFVEIVMVGKMLLRKEKMF